MNRRIGRLAALTLAFGWTVEAGAQSFPPPPPQQGPTLPAPAEDDLNLLLRDMAANSRALADAMRAELAGAPGVDAMIRDARSLADTTAGIAQFRRVVGPDLSRDRAAYAEVDGLWHRLDRAFAEGGAPASVARSVARLGQVDAALHRSLRLALPGDDGGWFGRPPQPGGTTSRPSYRPPLRPTAVALPIVEGLSRESDRFLTRFVTTSVKVPEGAGFAADLTALRDVCAGLAADLRREAPPVALAAGLDQLNRTWGVLKARLDRVGRGRPGPNIAELLDMGATVEQVNELLGPLVSPPPRPINVPYRNGGPGGP